MKRFWLVAYALVCTGCPSTPPSEVVSGLRTWSASQTSSSQALIEIEVPVEAGETSFIITAESGHLLALEYIYTPDFEIVLDSTEIREQGMPFGGGLCFRLCDIL